MRGGGGVREYDLSPNSPSFIHDDRRARLRFISWRIRRCVCKVGKPLSVEFLLVDLRNWSEHSVRAGFRSNAFTSPILPPLHLCNFLFQHLSVVFNFHRSSPLLMGQSFHSRPDLRGRERVRSPLG